MRARCCQFTLVSSLFLGATACEADSAEEVETAETVETAEAVETTPSDETLSPETDVAEPEETTPGPSAEVLVKDIAMNAIGLALDHVYFATDTTVARIPKSGGATETLHTLTESAVNDIEVDDTRVTWTESFASLVGGAIRTCPATGCGGEPTTIRNPGESTGALSMSADHVVWISGTRNIVFSDSAWSYSGVSPRMLADVAIAGDEVFVADGGLRVAQIPGAVVRCSINEAPCTPTTLSATVDNPQHIVVAGDHVLVLSDKGLYRMGRDGSDFAQLTPLSFHGYTSLASDGVDVYWAIAGELFGCAIDDCAPRSLATAEEFTRDIAVDATHVYWATFQIGIGTIWKIAR